MDIFWLWNGTYLLGYSLTKFWNFPDFFKFSRSLVKKLYQVIFYNNLYFLSLNSFDSWGSYQVLIYLCWRRPVLKSCKVSKCYFKNYATLRIVEALLFILWRHCLNNLRANIFLKYASIQVASLNSDLHRTFARRQLEIGRDVFKNPVRHLLLDIWQGSECVSDT